MDFIDTAFSREHRFSIGIERSTEKQYLSIPVSNRRADYNEFYYITGEQYQQFRSNLLSALPFVEQCRRREHDDLLAVQPGADRGVPL